MKQSNIPLALSFTKQKSSFNEERSCLNRYHSRSFVQVGYETTYAAIGNHIFFTKTCHFRIRMKQLLDLAGLPFLKLGGIYNRYHSRFFVQVDKNSIYALALQRSLIILVGLTMTCFSEKKYDFHFWPLAQKILNGILNILCIPPRFKNGRHARSKNYFILILTSLKISKF